MTQLLESNSRQRRRRFVLPRWSANPETRSVQIGIVGTVLVHLLLFWLGPKLLRLDEVHALPKPPATQQFNIELAPEAPAPQQKEPPPKNFVEANPDAPDNVPDKTNNFAAQNQQVAQEKPTPDGKSEMPALEGQTEIKTNQIVDGRLTKPSERLPSPPSPEEQPEPTPPVAPPAQEQNPLPGFEKQEGQDAAGIGSNVAKISPNPKPIPNKVEGLKDVPLIQGAESNRPMIDPKRPQRRPSLVSAPSTRPAIFTENKFGTANIGLTAVNAKFSKYGEYLQKFIESVQIQWERILTESRIYPPPGSMVTVKFIMNQQGAIARIVSVDSHTTQQAAAACTSAITARSPYGEWTDDMIAVLGQEQELTFTFYYQ